MMPVWCTKRSLPGSSGVMKPKPFSSLNHFTVPVGMCLLPPAQVLNDRGGCNEATTCVRLHNFAERMPGDYRAQPSAICPGKCKRPVETWRIRFAPASGVVSPVSPNHQGGTNEC